jgi:hypothetical protein
VEGGGGERRMLRSASGSGSSAVQTGLQTAVVPFELAG